MENSHESSMEDSDDCLEPIETPIGLKIVKKSVPSEDKPKKKKGVLVLKNKKIHLTYRHHINKAILIEFIEDMAPTEFIRCAHETADPEHPYEHTHVLINFSKPFRSKNCRIFDIETEIIEKKTERIVVKIEDGVNYVQDVEVEHKVMKDIHPNIKPVRTMRHWNNCKKYLGKQDPENKDCWDEALANCLVAKVAKCRTRHEVLQLADKPGDVAGLLLAFDVMNKAPNRSLVSSKGWVDWMKMLYNILMKEHLECENIRGNIEPEVDEFVPMQRSTFEEHEEIMKLWDEVGMKGRRLRIIYDPFGGKGKSSYCKVFKRKHPKCVFTLPNLCSVKDMVNLIMGCMQDGSEPSVILVDLSRTQEETKITQQLETLIDGQGINVKYHCKPVEWPVSSVTILTNTMPDFDLVSLDRWEIIELFDPRVCYPEGTHCWRYLSLSEAKAIRKASLIKKRKDEYNLEQSSRL